MLLDNVDKSITNDYKKYADIISEILHERRTVREGPEKLAKIAAAQAGSKTLLERSAAEAGAFKTASGLIVNHLVSGSGEP